MAEPNRKLAAILSADVVGYGRLMQDDEAATVETLKEYRVAIGRVIARHKGHVVNSPGDNMLAQFPSAVEAVQAAVEIQKVLEGRNLELAPERRMSFRIGVNLGDVIEEADGTLYGDGVNIAARMEALADAGGICISSTVHDSIVGKLDFGFEFLGAQQVKNIDRPINVYRVRAEQAVPTSKPRPRWLVPVLAGTTAVIAIAIAASLIWWPEETTPEDIQVEVAADDPVLALPTGPSIAVLPFDDLSGDPEQEYFADGIAEEIITGLTRFRNLFVIGRNSSFQYKGQSVDIRKIGEELGVRYVVEGTVRRAADTIRISAQLTDATSGASLWAESYDRTLSAKNILAVQDEITDQIVGTIADARGVIWRAELLESKRAGTELLESYECVLHARQFFVEITESAHLRARECLERTVAIDPDYAEAWAWLGENYLYEFAFGYNVQSDQPDPLNRAFEAGRRAVSLDPRNPIGHYILAQAYYHLNDLDSFHKEADLALNLNPNDANLLGFIGYFKGAAGQWQLGGSLARKAMTLNPQGAVFQWVITIYNDHYSRQEYEQALAAIKNWPNPDFFWLHVNLASVYGQLGDTENGHVAVARILELYPEFGNRARDEVEIWIRDKDWVDNWLEGLRKAGLDVAEEPPPTTN